ncbi:hypothetical protein [Burkholderia pyrrocinia]|uniref:hypothetical protein n=1 Tax=Burkholderia pyrrocinia TaxID=60550 RepID=UPI0012601402|nr:hypothetical protein [Burkholderia pyrrocinia]
MLVSADRLTEFQRSVLQSIQLIAMLEILSVMRNKLRRCASMQAMAGAFTRYRRDVRAEWRFARWNEFFRRIGRGQIASRESGRLPVAEYFIAGIAVEFMPFAVAWKTGRACGSALSGSMSWGMASGRCETICRDARPACRISNERCPLPDRSRRAVRASGMGERYGRAVRASGTGERLRRGSGRTLVASGARFVKGVYLPIGFANIMCDMPPSHAIDWAVM